MSVITLTKTGNKATVAAKLDKKVFGATPKNHELIKQAYVAYLANGRSSDAVTKTRGLVRGGGRKPWRQKGTGRARFGSSRNPIWRGGGIVFGPTGNENYAHKLPPKMKHQALRQALSLAADESRLIIIEALSNLDGKTKDLVAVLKKAEAKGNILLVVEEKDASKERAAKNIPGLNVVSAKYLTVYDLVNADHVIMSQKALEIVHDWLGGKK